MQIDRITRTAPVTTPDTSSERPFDSSHPAVEVQDRRDYDALTTSDKDFLQAVTGRQITAGSGMPMLALQVSSDRQSGKLPAGSAITFDYLRELVSRQPSAEEEQSPLTEAHLHRAQEFLSAHGGHATTDFTA